MLFLRTFGARVDRALFAYLEPEYQDHDRSQRAWEELQAQVVNALEELQS